MLWMAPLLTVTTWCLLVIVSWAYRNGLISRLRAVVLSWVNIPWNAEVIDVADFVTFSLASRLPDSFATVL